MMRRSWLLTLALIVSGAISLFLTYVLIFGSPATSFNFLLSESSSIRTSESSNKNSAFEITRMQAFLPTQVIYYQDSNTYMIQNSEAIDQAMRLFDLTYNPANPLKIVEDVGYYQEIVSEQSWEYIFAAPIPIQQLSYVLSGIESVDDDLLVDRILLSEKNHSLYFMNSQDYRVAQILLPNDVQISQYLAPLQAVAHEGVEVIRVGLKRGSSYLPKDEIALPTYVYTLKKQSDAGYIAKFFEKQSYQLSSTNKENEKKYFTIDHSLTIDSNINLYSAKITVLQNRKSGNDNQLALDSFNVYRLFETWTEGVRYINNHGKPAFQRYLKNYPIVSSGTKQYALQTFEMQPRATTIAGTTLNLHLNIADLSEQHRLPNLEMVESILQKSKHTLQDYHRVYIGYVWQREMEEFQLATYVPAWIFETDGEVYQLAQGQDKLERIDE